MWQITGRTTRLRTSEIQSHIERSLSHACAAHVSRQFCTSGASSGLSQNHDIYLSTSPDPYFNLTLEDWLFRHSPPNRPLLLIYRDSPCVVIGRNQNPWTEINFSALHASGVPFLRRRSGGGTVYHDLGNTNFSIHLPRTSFDRHATGQLVLAGVKSLGIGANLNDRNDICVGTDKISLDSFEHSFLETCQMKWYSMALGPLPDCLECGSAYKIVNNRAYHHGTMLISTELDTLGNVLSPPKAGIVTKGVGSVRSPVCNLQKYDKTVTHETFTSATVEQFRREFGISSEPCFVHDTEETKSIDYIKKGMSELLTWNWMYGQTPEFTQTLTNMFTWGQVTVEIHTRHGIILDTRVDTTDAHIPDTEISALCTDSQTFLEGKRYGFLGEIPAEVAWTQLMQDLYSWLQQATNVPL